MSRLGCFVIGSITGFVGAYALIYVLVRSGGADERQLVAFRAGFTEGMAVAQL